jgi:hypothetical protein
MASHVLRDGRYPVGGSVSVYLRAAKNPGGAPNGAAVAGPFTTAADGTTTATGLLDGVDYTWYASVSSVPTYTDFRTEKPAFDVKESAEDERRRLWMSGGAVGETILVADVVSGAIPLASGTLLLAGGIVLPAKKTVTRVTFVSGTTARTPGTNEWFCIVRQSDLNVLAVTADETVAALAANTARELVLSAPLTVTDDTPIYLGICSVGGTPPSLAGSMLNNAVAANALGAPIRCGTSSTGLTTPVAVGSTVSAITATANYAYALVR